MSSSCVEQRHASSTGARSCSATQPGEHVASPGDSALISVSARLLFANGQTTARTVAAVEQLADGLGFRATVVPRWGELTIRIDDDTGSRYEIIAVEPVGVDMSKVAATMSVIDEVRDGRLDAEAARSALEAIERFPPVSVAAYGTFFAMPWRMLPIPILIGMLAHALRWAAISLAGASVAAGAFIVCLVVGTLMTPIADRLRLPFAALAFAAVVSLIPGVFLFRMAGGFVGLVALGQTASPDLLFGVIADGTTAVLIILAMTFGLILPKMGIEHFYSGFITPIREAPGKAAVPGKFKTRRYRWRFR